MKKFPFLFKPKDTTTTTTNYSTSTPASWPWPVCACSPMAGTLSFRATGTDDTIYKTMNSAYSTCTSNSFVSQNEERFSFSSDELEINVESAVVRGLRSDRLFFEPGETSSVLEEAKYQDDSTDNEVSIMAVDSMDPFLDFRVSMEEMVEAHGLNDWECLEELLTCYLRVNEEINHGYILGAFVDLVQKLGFAARGSDHVGCSYNEQCSCSSSTATHESSFISPLSFTSSTFSMENEDHDESVMVIAKNAARSSSSSSSSSSLSRKVSSSGV